MPPLFTCGTGQRAGAGSTAVAVGAYTGQERPAQHSHRARDYRRRIVRDGGDEAAADQSLYAAISQPWADRNDKDRFRVIKENKLTEYLAQIA
jgi:hypothetical protein